MAKESTRQLVATERGSALVMVLLMLLVLLPLTLILGRLVMQWQRGATQFVSFAEQEYAARAGFEDALKRLGLNEFDLGVDESTEFKLDGIGAHGARVKVSREADAVLSLEGRVLEGIEATRADLDRTGWDHDLRRVYQFRKLEICRVEVIVPGPRSLAGVRLWGVVVRAPNGPWQRAGLRVDRGFFSEDPT